MIRKHKNFARPRKAYDMQRIKQENALLERFGLKNKREIWKAEAQVAYFRSRAKDLITAPSDEQETFFNKLSQIGLKVNSVADVLALQKEDILRRRLATVVAERRLAATPKQARQLIAHKKVRIEGRVVNVPSYLVKVEEENSISIKESSKKPKVEEKANE